MRTDLRKGTRIGVLVDPDGRAVEVYRPAHEPERHEKPDQVAQEPELSGFVLELGPVFEE